MAARKLLGISKLTDETFDLATAARKPTLVVFVAAWCSPSRGMLSELEALAPSIAGFADIVTVDVNEAQAVSMRAGLVGLPTVMLYQRGKLLAEKLGAMKRRALRSWVVQSLDNKPG